jgi:ERCC4-related helicase
MIKDFTPRMYQQTILGTASNNNALVVLPTGMGKTGIFLLLCAQRLRLYPQSKILFIGPTRPLIDQYYEVFKKHFIIDQKEMCMMTGMVSPEERRKLWENSKIIFSTPQGLENDILSGKIKLDNVSLLGFDEAHRAVGNYAYVFVAKQYHKQANYERILALTASPGDSVEKIDEVCQNLFIKIIEYRNQDSPDVQQYIQKVDFEKIMVELPQEYLEIKKYLELSYQTKLKEVRNYGYLQGAVNEYNKTDLLKLQGALQGKLREGEKEFDLLKSISLIAEALKLHHALELIETQDASALQSFFEKLHSEASSGRIKATQNLVRDINVRTAMIKTDSLVENHIEHPKLIKLKEIIKKFEKAKIIIFSQYRDMGLKIVQALEKESVSAMLFVGQQKKKNTGLSQKQQKNMLDAFREGRFRVLVSSSVGEEGLDIPQVDLVIFYEPIPSAIRKIQRSGRTGRLEKGSVIVLSTKNTKDEAYHYVSINKEKRMERAIAIVKKQLSQKPMEKVDLNSFMEEKTEPLKIMADFREKSSIVLRDLSEKGLTIELGKLEIGDYLLGKDVVVEYKKVPDFVDSIIDGRMLAQLKHLNQYAKPLIIIEGTEDMYGLRKINHRAIKGMLATIVYSYGIPLLQTKNGKETSDIIEMIAQREMEKGNAAYSAHSLKPVTIKEQQEYVVSSLPGIGGSLNKQLLQHFKSIKNMVNASEYALKIVDLIGPKKAKQLRELFEKEYEE